MLGEPMERRTGAQRAHFPPGNAEGVRGSIRTACHQARSVTDQRTHQTQAFLHAKALLRSKRAQRAKVAERRVSGDYAAHTDFTAWSIGLCRRTAQSQPGN